MKSSSTVKYTENIKNIFHTGAAKQLIFMIGIAISVALGIVLYMSIQEPIYRPLDYQVTSDNMATIVDTLDKAGIDYKINDKDGVVLVPAKDLQQAKFKLSALGVSKNDNFTYAFLNDKNSFSNSQFIDGMRYVHALENDLAKTINAIEGVSGAKVHIAIPKSNVYTDETNRVTASVVLNVSPNFASNHEKVRSIVQIVADSVSGLDPKDVAITDQYGHFLSDSINQDSIYSAAQLSYQNTIQSYYEKRIESMIAPILGENKITVRVNANIDFTQQEDAQEQYDPDKKVIRSEQTNTEQTNSGGSASGPPGSLSNSPPSGDASKSQSAATGGAEKSQSNKNYELTKTVTYKKSNFAKIRGLSAAVVVDNVQVIDPKTKQTLSKPLDKEMLDKITELVKTTIGFDESRGDKVTVVNSSYSPIKENLVTTVTPIWDEVWFWEWVKRTVGMILGFILLFILYRKMSKLGLAIKANPSTALVSHEYDDITQALARTKEIQKEGIEKLKQLAVSEPNRVANVMKSWVGKQ